MNKYIPIVAANKTVQKALIEVMFSGCERDTDIWEYLEGSEYPNDIHKMLFGLSKEDGIALYNAESPEEERSIEDRIDYDAVYYAANKAACQLIDAVRDNLLNEIK
jgi:hypothetical protein